MSYSFSISGLKTAVNKYLYWLIYIFSEKIVWIFLTLIFTFITSFSILNNNSSFLFNSIIREYVYFPLIVGMIISVFCMVPFIVCFEYIPYYFHINNFTNNCRKNRSKYKEKIMLYFGLEVNDLIKKNIIDLYNMYIDIVDNRQKRKELTLLFKKYLCLDYLGPRNVKIISEIKSVSKKMVVLVSRIEEDFEDNNGSIHALESTYVIKKNKLVLKKIEYIGGRNI